MQRYLGEKDRAGGGGIESFGPNHSRNEQAPEIQNWARGANSFASGHSTASIVSHEYSPANRPPDTGRILVGQKGCAHDRTNRDRRKGGAIASEGGRDDNKELRNSAGKWRTEEFLETVASGDVLAYGRIHQGLPFLHDEDGGGRVWYDSSAVAEACEVLCNENRRVILCCACGWIGGS